MAHEFGFRFTATGALEERDRLKTLIELHAQKLADGEYFVHVGDLLGLPDAIEAFCLVPTWEGRFDNVPVRNWNDELVMRGYSRHTPPLKFAKEVSRKYPGLECHLKCTDLGTLLSEHLVAQGGKVECLELHVSDSHTGQIDEWETAGLVWAWKGERQQDLAMLHQFLRVKATGDTIEEELAYCCERAYDALAFPGVECPSRANGHVYSMAKQLLEHRAEVRKYAYLDGLYSVPFAHDPEPSGRSPEMRTAAGGLCSIDSECQQDHGDSIDRKDKSSSPQENSAS